MLPNSGEKVVTKAKGPSRQMCSLGTCHQLAWTWIHHAAEGEDRNVQPPIPGCVMIQLSMKARHRLVERGEGGRTFSDTNKGNGPSHCARRGGAPRPSPEEALVSQRFRVVLWAYVAAVPPIPLYMQYCPAKAELRQWKP